MFDIKKLGIKILGVRKDQGLTQEQLGNAIGISAQAVSKWENGESAPDISILPELCRVLSISADDLLGVENTVGFDNLCSQMANRFGKAKPEERMKLFIYLQKAKMNFPDNFSVWEKAYWNKGSNIVYGLNREKLENVDFWAGIGFVAFIMPDLLASPDPDDEVMDIIRTAVLPENWEIVKTLLGGPKKPGELKKALKDRQDNLNAALENLTSKGLVIQDKFGYGLDTNFGLYLAGIIKAVGVTLLPEQSGGRGVSVNKTAI